MSNDNLLVIDGRDLGITLIEDELIDTYLPDIKAEGLALYMVLARLAKRGNNTPSQAALGAMLDWHRDTVGKWLKVLEDAGLLSATRRYEQNIEISKAYRLLSVRKNPAAVQVQIGAEKFGTDTTTATGNGSADEQLPITRVWEQEAKAMLSPMLGQELFDLQDTHGYQTVVDAIKEAVITQGVGSFNVKYVAAILQRWAREGREAAKPAATGEGQMFESWRTVY